MLDAGREQVFRFVDLDLRVSRNDDHQAIAQQVLLSSNEVLLSQVVGPHRIRRDEKVSLGSVDNLLGQRGRGRKTRLDGSARVFGELCFDLVQGICRTDCGEHQDRLLWFRCSSSLSCRVFASACRDRCQ